MESISYSLFLISMGAASVATCFYWAYSLRRASVLRVASARVSPGRNDRHEPWALIGATASAGLYVAFLTLTGSIAARALAVARPPLGNLWEFTLAFAWGIVFFTALAERIFKQRSVSAVILPGALVLMAIALIYFPSGIRPLVPALQANRILGLHVSVMLMAYSAFSVSFGSAILYLFQNRGGDVRFRTLPDLETLEDMGYWSVIIGFPLLALGLALGAWWGNIAWGRYWGWDPKETSALVTWLIYALYLHAHGLRGWQGRRSAAVLVLGYVAVLFTYFAVNFWIPGLHSYAGV